MLAPRTAVLLRRSSLAARRLADRGVRFFLAFLLSFSGIMLPSVVQPPVAMATPALSVSTSVSRALVGGTARVTITVTNNTGDPTLTKGYNLSIDTTVSNPATNAIVAIKNPTVAPTTQQTLANGSMRLSFVDLVDLEKTESYSLSFDVDISKDPNLAHWEVGQLVQAVSLAQVNVVPDNSGAWITASSTGTGQIIPYDLVYKRANQSTGVQQDTGTGTRKYSYTILVQNNYRAPSASIVVTDTLPDGVEYLGMLTGPSPDFIPTHDPVTGRTDLRWTLGNMAASQATTITYQVGIRYDYYGTANNGIGRDDSNIASLSVVPTDAVIPHKSSFTNSAGLSGAYRGSLAATITPSDSDTATVEGTYVTIAKTSNKSMVGYGTLVDFTITVPTSQYYTADNLTVTDFLQDGVSYVPGTAQVNGGSVSPTSSLSATSGITTILFGPDLLPPLSTTDSLTITFQGSVNSTWEADVYQDQPIRAGDSLANKAQLEATWHDTIKTGRNDTDLLVAAVAAGMDTGLPTISKEVWDPVSASWVDSISAQVGDVLLYRVRFNTNSTTWGLGSPPVPTRTDITLGAAKLTDWLPPGTVYNGDANPAYRDINDFQPSALSTWVPDPVTPHPVTIQALNGIEWYLGDVADNGAWATTFTVTVADTPVVAPGLKTGNHWKLTGINTFGQEYSDRDICDLNYVAPTLALTKSASVPTTITASSPVTYTIDVDNTGLGYARAMVVTDTLPPGMRVTAPTIVAAQMSTLPAGPLGTLSVSDYSSTWDSSTGSLVVTLSPDVNPGSRLRLQIRATVDSTVAAGVVMINRAVSGCWDQRNRTGRRYTSNIGTHTLTTTKPLITKTAPTTGRYTIGNTWVDTLTVTVPAGAILYWPQLFDTMDRDGVVVVPGTSVLSTVSGTPVSGAVLAAAEPTRTATTNNRTRFGWRLTDPIDNRGQATSYVFRLAFRVMYNGLEDNGTLEMALPTVTDRVRDTTVSVDWSYTTSSSAISTQTVTTANVDTPIGQPALRLTKTPSSVLPFAGSQTVTYTTTIVNAGTTTAYDMNWFDGLPTYLGTPTLVSVRKGATDLVPSITTTFSTVPTITIDFLNVSLAQNETITVVYTAKVDPEVPAGASLKNFADVDWASLPDTATVRRSYNDTEAWTADETSATIITQMPTVVKTVAPGSPSTFGNTATYNLRVTVPTETVVYNAQITDVMPYGIGTLVGSPTVTQVSGSPDFFNTSPAWSSNRIQAVGTTTTLLFGNIDNADAATTDGDIPVVFDVTYTVMLTDTQAPMGSWLFWPATPSNTVTNTARLAWSTGTTTSTVTAQANVPVRQPVLTLDKTETTTGPYQGGDSVGYRSVITNTGNSPAYDLSWTDIIDPLTSGASITAITHSTSGSVIGLATIDVSSEPTLSISLPVGVSLAPGESLTIDYTLGIDPGVGAGSTLTNVADIDWTSMPGVNTDERIYNDGSLEATYSADTDTETVDVLYTVVSKTIPSGVSTYTIGDTFTYRVRFTLPTNTNAYNMSVTDTVPDGLTVLSATPSAAIGSVTIAPEASGATPITWAVGDVTNPPVTSVDLDVTVRVDDAYFSATNLDGLPAGIDGDGRDSISNAATVTWDDKNVGGKTRSSSSTTTISIAEPHLTIDKVSSETTLAAGSTTTYTVTVANDGVSTAYDISWRDTLPAELFSAGVSPQLASVHKGASLLAAPGDYSATFGAQTTSTVDFVADLAPGESFTIVYTAKLNGGVADGFSLVNTATVPVYSSGDGVVVGERTYGPIWDTAVVTGKAPRLSITKTRPGDGQVQASAVVPYRVVVTNTGTAPAYSVVVTDTLPLDLTYRPLTTSASWPSGSSTMEPLTSGQTSTWTMGGTVSLLPGESLTIDYSADVAASPVTGSKVNTATTAATDGGGSPVPSDTDTATVLVTRPSIALTKVRSSADATIQVGENVTFTFVVTNDGTTSIAQTLLTDTYDAAYLLPISATPATTTAGPATLGWGDITAGSLAPGASTTVTATFRAIAVPPARIASDLVQADTTIDQYGDGVATKTASASVAITRPDVTVTKIRTSTDSFVQPGQQVTYDIGVRNSGDTDLVTVPLSDSFDATKLAFVSASNGGTATGATVNWADIGALNVGQTATVTATFVATASTAGASSVDTATVSGATDLWGDHPPVRSSTATVAVTLPAISLAKALVSGDPHVRVGEQVAFSLTATNTGDTTLTTVPLSDTWNPLELGFVTATVAPVAIPGSASWADVGPLAPGAARTITATFTVLSQPAIPGIIVNSAETTGVIDLHSDSPTGAVAAATVEVVRPDVALTKIRRGPFTRVVGDSVGFDIEVENSGDTTLTTVTLTDSYDATPLTFLSASDGGAGGAGTVSWPNLGPLSPGAKRSVSVTFTASSIPAGGITTDTATVASVDRYGHTLPSRTASDAVRIVATDVDIDKTLVSDPYAQVGDPVVFDLTITNSGGTTLSEVGLSDTFDPAFLAPVTASVSIDASSSGFIGWNNIGPLAPGASRTVTVTFTALAATPIATVDTASVAATDTFGVATAPKSNTATVTVTAPDIAIDKRLVGDAHVQAGDTVTFEVEFTNSGDTTLASVPATDTYDASALTFVSATNGGAGGGGTVSWANVGPLSPGASIVSTLTFTAAAVPAGNTTTDTAVTSGTDIWGDPAGPASDSAAVQITRPDIAITKALISDDHVQVGQEVAFDLTVENTGDTTLTTVPLADAFDETYLTFTTATVAPSTTGVGSLGWDVGPLGPGDLRTVTVTFTAALVPFGNTTTDTATVSGTDIWGDPAGPRSDTATVAITAPSIDITKKLVGDQHVQVGETVTFDLVVTNTGDSELATVTVMDFYDPFVLELTSAPSMATTSPGIMSVSGIGPLAVGQTTTVTVSFVALGVPSGNLTLDMGVTFGYDIWGDPAGPDLDVAFVEITAPDIAIDKRLVSDAHVQVGDTVTFEVEITNSGDTTLSSVPATDTYDASALTFVSATNGGAGGAGVVSWANVGPISPGASIVSTLTFTAAAVPVGNTTTDTAVTSGTDIWGDPVGPASDSDAVQITAPDIAIDKRLVSDAHVQVGQSVVFEVEITNSGDTTLSSVPATDTYDSAALTFVSATNGGAGGAGVVSWANVGPLAPGASIVSTLTFTAAAVPAGNTTTDTAVTSGTDIWGDSAGPASDSDSVQITAPDIAIDKRLVSDAHVQVGQSVVFEVEITNSGDTTLASVPATDTYDSAALTFVSATNGGAGGSGTVSWANVGPLAPGASIVSTLTFTAAAVPVGNTTTDTAVTSGTDIWGDPVGPKSDDASVQITRPDIAIDKRLVGDAHVQVGDTVAFEVEITNSGDTTLTSVPATDTYDASSLTFVSATNGGAGGGGTVSWANVGPLAPGASIVSTVTFTAAAVPAGNTTTDTAVTSGTDIWGDPAGPASDSAAVQITAPNIAIDKRLVSDAHVQVGQSVVFQIDVTNSGDTTLATVPLSDTYDSAYLLLAETPLGATTGPGTVNWANVGPLAPGAMRTVTVTFTAAAVPVGNTTTDTAVTSGTDIWGDPVGPASDSDSVQITAPDIAIDKRLVSDAHAQVGQSVFFEVEITNSGDTTLSSVPATDTYDASALTFVSATNGGAGGAGVVSWANVGPISPGASIVSTVTFTAAAVPAGNTTTDTAVTSGTDVWGDPAGPASDSAAVQITAPSIAIDKRLVGDAHVQVGDTVTFEVEITNSGDTTLSSVPATDTYDASALTFVSATNGGAGGAGVVSWANVGPLAPGASIVSTLTFAAAAVPAGNTTTDTAVTSGTDIWGDPAGPASDSDSVQITAPDIAIDKRLVGDAHVQVGDTVTFEVEITNSGDTTLSSVPATDTYDASALTFVSATNGGAGGSGTVSWANVGPISPGASIVSTLTFTAAAVPVGNTTTDTAVTSGTDIWGDPVGPASDSDAVQITAPDIAIDKRLVSDAHVQVGDTVTFEVEITNSGDTTLASVPATDTYDASSLTFVSATNGGAGGGGTVSWANVGPLAPGASTVSTLTFTAAAVPVGNTTTDTAVTSGTDIWGDPVGPKSDDASVQITRPDIAIDKRLVGDAHVQVGQSVVFQIDVTNSGDTTLATVPLSDTYDSAYLLLAETPLGATTGPGTVNWANVGPLAPGAMRTLTVTFTAAAVPAGNTTTNTAVTSGTDIWGDPAGPASDSAAVQITAPDIAIDKRLVSDAHAQVGQSVVFEVEITNSGDTTLSSVPATDTYDASALTFVSATNGGAGGGGTVSWANVGPLAPGASIVSTLTFTAAAVPAGNTTTDTAVTSGTDVWGDPVGPKSDDASVQITRPDIAIDKQLISDAHVQVGEPVAFTLTVTNSGDTTLATVPLSDSFDSAALTFSTATVSPDTIGAGALGWSDTGSLAPGVSRTVTVTFTAAAVPAGNTTTDTATTSGTDIWGDTAGPRSDTASVAVTAPDVTITKATAAAQDLYLQVGQAVTYDLVITNNGDTRLSSVPVTDTFESAYLTFISATSAPIASGDTLVWSNVGPLDPGESRSISVTFEAAAVPPTMVTTDTATVSGTDIWGDPTGPAEATAYITITDPGVNLVKTLEAGQDPQIQVGEQVTFLLSVVNAGTTALKTVPLADTFDPAELTYVSASRTPDTVGTGSLAWNDLGPIAVGDVATVSVTFEAASVPVSGVSLNSAETTGVVDEHDDFVPGSTDTEPITITRPEVTITKSLVPSQDATVQPGQSVGYDIVVRNSGTTTITTLPLIDVYEAAYLTFTSASVTPSSVTAGSLGWNNVGPLKPGEATTITVTFTAATVPPVRTTPDTATAGIGTDEYGDPVPADESTATVAITDPKVTLTKSLAPGQDPFVQVGQTVTWVLSVTNSGDTTITGIDLADTYDALALSFSSATVAPGSATPGSLGWHLGPLGPSRETTIGVTFTVTARPATGTTINHASTRRTIDEFSDPVPDKDADAPVAITRPGVSIDKSLETSLVAPIGTEVSYLLHITNSGDTTLATVPVVDVFDSTRLRFVSATPAHTATTAASVSWADVTGAGVLVPGASTDVHVRFIATAPGMSVTDTATVTGATDVNGDVAGDATDTDNTLTTSRPAVRVDKELIAPATHVVAVGQQATYRLTVTNTGDTTLTTVPLTDTFEPATLAFSSALPAPDSTTASSVSWNDLTGAGVLAPGASVSVTVVFTALAEDVSAIDVATVHGAIDVYDTIADDDDDIDETLAVYDPRNVTITKDSLPANGTVMLPGQTVTYTVSVVNSSAVAIPDVIISDAIPVGTTYAAGTLSVAHGAGFTAATDADDADEARYIAAPGSLGTVEAKVGTITAHSTASLRFAVTVSPEELSKQGIINIATGTTAGSPLGDSNVVVHGVDPIELTKTAKDLNGGKLKPGDVIEWTIRLENTGIVPTVNTVIRDTVPAETTYVDGSIKGVGADDSKAPQLVWMLGTVEVGGVRTVTFRSRVNAGLPNGTRIRNQAIATADNARDRHSDAPETPVKDDPTLLRTGANDWIWLGGSLVAMLLGLWFIVVALRRRRNATA